MFMFYGVRIDDGMPLTSRNDYYLVTNLERDVFMISPFFPSNIFGNVHAYFDEMYVYSYGRDTYTMNNLKWRCSTEEGFHEVSDVEPPTGIFHAKTILMRRGDDCWIVTTTANMQHSCYDGIYNIYMRRKIMSYQYKQVISTYEKAIRAKGYTDEVGFGIDINKMIDLVKRIKDGSKSAVKEMEQELSKEWRLSIGTNLPSLIFDSPDSDNIVVCTNEVNFKSLEWIEEKVKCVYYSKSDIAKVYNENCCKKIPRMMHSCKNHIKLYITNEEIYFGSMNMSESAYVNVESMSALSNKCIRECVKQWMNDLVIHVHRIDAVPHDDSSEVLSVGERLQGDRACEQEVQGSPRDVPLQPRPAGK